MKFKKYSKGNDLHIKEKVDFYAKEFGSGIYLVLKNRNGSYDYFIRPNQLIIELNAADKVALENDSGINVYCHYHKHFDTLVSSIDEHETKYEYVKNSELDGII